MVTGNVTRAVLSSRADRLLVETPQGYQVFHIDNDYPELSWQALWGKVVYEGYKNPSYFKNSGLDGWYTENTPDGRQLILRKNAARDGKITIWEIYLALESKKNRLVESNMKKL